MFKNLDNYFTFKRKGAAAIAALGFALVWALLWHAFPMEFYSLFFYRTSIFGSNLQLILLNIVVLLPMLWLFTRLTATDLSFSKTVLLNMLLLIAADYVFALFLFGDKFYICVIALILHGAVNVWVFGSAETVSGKAPKGMKAPASKGEKAIKKQPLITVIWAAAFAFVSEAASFALMYIMAHIYVNA